MMATIGAAGDLIPGMVITGIPDDVKAIPESDSNLSF
jgi:hypothetical protein